MTPILQLMFALAITIMGAKLGGLASQKLRQPAVLGELVVGLLLGPSVLNFFHWPIFSDPHLEENFLHLAELGVVFLMFFAGLEIDLEEMLKTGRVATFAGVLGVVVPLVMGGAAAVLFGYPTSQALFIGMLLTATSVSISAQTLMELRVLRSPPGLALLAAAVIDDVLVILLLSVFVAVNAGGSGVGAVSLVLVKMIVYLVGASVLGAMFLPRLARWFHRSPISQGLLAFSLVATLLFAVAAEVLGGVAAITGAFIAGVLLGRSPVKHDIEHGMHAVTYSFFVPIFFVSIGVLVDLHVLTLDILPFVLLICLIAVLSKVLGAGGGALLGGFTRPQALQVGVGMVSRGEVGLIVAAIGIDNGLIGDEGFVIAVIVVLVTTLVTPLLLRLTFRNKQVPLPLPPAPVVD